MCVSILRNIFEFDMSQLLPRAYDLRKEKNFTPTVDSLPRYDTTQEKFF